MAQSELNLRDYLRIFRKRKFVIILVFLVVSIVGGIYFSQDKVLTFQAVATIKIEERKTIAGLLTEEIVFNPGDMMESETKIIRGYPIMKQVALKMGKIKADSPPDQVDTIISDLQESIETERVGQTNMIRIIATADQPKEAMDRANMAAQGYMDESLAEKTKQARSARQFIEEQLASIEARLNQAEERMRSFGGEDRGLSLGEPIQQKLISLEAELAEAAQKFTDKHPQILQLKARIKDLESQLKNKVGDGNELDFSRVSRELEVNKKLYGMLKEKLEEARITEAQKVGDVSLVNPAVMPGAPLNEDNNVKILMSMFMGLILGVAAAFVLEMMDTSIGTIDDVENVVKLPVLGIIPSIDNEMQKDTKWLERMKIRFFPTARTDDEERRLRLVSHFLPRSPIAEAYRNIHTNLKIGPFRKTILVTSSGPREGKSTVVCNLGLVMAQAGLKTLLISADLRRPVLGKVFGIKRAPGLSELIMGTVTLDEALYNITDIMLGELGFEDIRKTPGIENIWIIPTGELPFNPAEILDSKNVLNLIEVFKTRFDVVIFDAPPVLPVTDSSLLAPKVDAVVMVYEIGRTSREALIRAKVQIESTGAKISGVILNHTKLQTEAVSVYPYHYQKYKYYGSPEDEKGSPKEVHRKSRE